MQISQWAIPELTSASVSKQVLMQNFSYYNEFDLLENECAGETHFYQNGFTLSHFHRGKNNLEMVYVEKARWANALGYLSRRLMPIPWGGHYAKMSGYCLGGLS